MSKVRLAIRVRPFTDRELRAGDASEPVVTVEDEQTLSITNLKVAASGAGDSRLRVRRYRADFCLDSSCAPDLPGYASQEKVFSTVGSEVLDTVLNGRSACVLAYGQSATGKTHSMLGTAAEPGLVPRLCRELTAVTVSFLEIYNERVHDLLSDVEWEAGHCGSLPRRRGNTRKDLRVREHPTRGPYVQNLRRVVVRDSEQLCALVWAAAARRSTAATRRNPLSSRSHALLQLSTAAATLHLADLAGSEKAGLEGSSFRGLQKEGANINKSLVALSNVISALVCGGGGGARGGGAGSGGGGVRGRHVPYRDSALTWLLKDCFTGGAATFILATVSASRACYGESASTLRWAARARQLATATPSAGRPAPLPTPDPGGTAQRLREQLAALHAALLSHRIRFIPETGLLEHDPRFWNISTVACIEGEHKMDSNKYRRSIPENIYGSSESSVTTNLENQENKQIQKCEGINGSVDNVFGPALERAVSGQDLKVAIPLRNRRRQYRSHEVLPTMAKPKAGICQETVSLSASIAGDSMKNVDQIEMISVNSEESVHNDTSKAHVPYQVESPRAEIVASVTERLYTKLKKKEESAISKVENVLDKKIMEPLHELKICTNARQRLVEMSQRALRNTRRKIGIPAHTQTRSHVTRVKDEAIGVQTDLEPYCIKYDNTYKHYLNVYTETDPLTSRCKEVAVGPVNGSVHKKDGSTITEYNPIIFKSCSIMTDGLTKSENSTQTKIVPPPRKKKNSAFTKYLAPNNSTIEQLADKEEKSPVIRISISQELESLSDDSLELYMPDKPTSKLIMPPDLLSNHNPVDNDSQLSPNFSDVILGNEAVNFKLGKDFPVSQTTSQHNNSPLKTVDTSTKQSLDFQPVHTVLAINEIIKKTSDHLFSDGDVQDLPRHSIVPNVATQGINDMILGRSLNVYPYNITLSPNIERNYTGKKTVTFKQDTVAQTHLVSVSTQTYYPSRLPEDKPSKYLGSLESNTERLLYMPVQSTSSPNSLYDTSLPNLAINSIYKPPNSMRSPSYERPSQANTYKRFLFDDEDKPCDSPNSRCTSKRFQQTTSNYCRLSPTASQSDGSSEPVLGFERKKQFFEEEISRRRNRCPRYEKSSDSTYCYSEDKKIAKSCDDFERSIKEHEDYIRRLNNRRAIGKGEKESVGRFSSNPKPPSSYLQQLINVRRNVVNVSKQEY